MFLKETEMNDAQKKALEHATRICDAMTGLTWWIDIFTCMGECDRIRAASFKRNLQCLLYGPDQVFTLPDGYLPAPPRAWWDGCRNQYLHDIAWMGRDVVDARQKELGELTEAVYSLEFTEKQKDDLRKGTASGVSMASSKDDVDVILGDQSEALLANPDSLFTSPKIPTRGYEYADTASIHSNTGTSITNFAASITSHAMPTVEFPPESTRAQSTSRADILANKHRDSHLYKPQVRNGRQSSSAYAQIYKDMSDGPNTPNLSDSSGEDSETDGSGCSSGSDADDKRT